ncbi:class I SAM-dependent methyltransferase [Agromyces protaetiae]|uniref:Class I SAM-dependent methyltransferase n=1 Tax=Agromyces protaetiae TaxID=2509455 RepID=A0A4P6FAG1_9MICO|nr:class I SAM-dependent methyltransferase [Agromyces protaetiae]QAY72645.1 class I SAM-dependent methyltransferase [Agromyces protaetiae]
MDALPRRERWNHNIEYHRVVLDRVPRGARSALDVGTGDGLLAVELSRVVEFVTAIDNDEGVLERAQADAPGSAVGWVCGDFAGYPLAEASFDLVASIATLHHFDDPGGALARMAELTAPGGALVVIGLARSRGIRDAAWEIPAIVTHRITSARREVWEHTAPTTPPRHTYAEMRVIARGVLPGSRFTRLALWRYAIVWERPQEVEPLAARRASV